MSIDSLIKLKSILSLCQAKFKNSLVATLKTNLFALKNLPIDKCVHTAVHHVIIT